MVVTLKISKEEFKNLYYKKGLNTYEISSKFGCCQATIWKKFKEFNLKSRPIGMTRVNLSKATLIELYSKKRLSTRKIEQKLCIPHGTIYRKLKEYGIITRNLADSNIKYPRKDFSHNQVEKAYLIGFCLGDLRVRKQYKGGCTINVACSSTVPAQIELIEDLFKKYGHVWIHKSKSGKIHTQASLNETFDFLLSKEVPYWTREEDSTFYAFLAGFIDAEGHFGIYNKMARFSLGNYSLQILNFLKNELSNRDINCLRVSDKRKGKQNSEGYAYRDNYTSLIINKKETLLALFNQLKPYIRHKSKIEALKKAEANILERNRRKNQ